ncbi:hypothetical protein SAMN05216296_0031 [Pseudomonas pohangensis]|uniref:Uncharacterized protein n=1 Tax=Pseudomonas pohangensis TaxID=364197 RepID=A0A1H2DUZ7_9PSED|nr:hypothetical protein SAMN05216296_0031 [Pseudomonas pohangensis]
MNKQKLSGSLSPIAGNSNIKPTLYSAQGKPDRNPWRKRGSLLDEAFSEKFLKLEGQIRIVKTVELFANLDICHFCCRYPFTP